MNKIKLELTEAQVWLVTKSLLELTSDGGEKRLLKEFPDMDFEPFVADIKDILNQFEKSEDLWQQK